PMGHFIRVTSLLACIAAGIAVAVWIVQRGEPSSPPSTALEDAPAWQIPTKRAASADARLPVILIPEDSGPAPTAGSTPKTKAIDQASSSLGWQIQIGKANIPQEGREAAPPLSGPWLLPPQSSVTQNVSPEVEPSAAQPQPDVPLSAITDVFRAVLSG